ncbi:DUF1127 domain-containing protein [Haematospirillum jordaniae]|uniref:YjiS-like domain-containing protein n=1 Tax=Haematospirillum jordaniae TaxID=1549855 RepID=A0A143DD14_9PROT|nr:MULTISPECIES: DUF1127 domain-containing protein [Haematospirillum]AMW34008.1 hypothetical protein AY555_01145 [Haematospirillum jordaniae]NKD44337.1 DUF1127 domain-containing protein [Haematospirillum jordaniae]NKD57357.1 DUF1127 domain-containing protein [Haematospirillum jordaniae]NKD59945.1 DUF1127 domain-containing protein [Haematospirillum jordaniae]NKD67812.1 DUF1127 domain-containing protein [Haematospirillum jordaniae]
MSASTVFGSLIEQFRSWRDRTREADLLRSMSDRELMDLGLSRGDVEQIIAGTYLDRRKVQARRQHPES